MRRLYTLFYTLWMPVILFHLLWRARSNREYLRYLPQRFGFGPPLPGAQPVLWLHAVSVGEVQAAVPLMRHLLDRYTHYSLLVTTTTPTGRDRVKQVMGERVEVRYLPYDLPSTLDRFLRQIKPDLLLIMETELWPNLLAQCARNAIPVYLINARLSARSARGYRRFFFMTQAMLKRVAGIAAQSQADATRLLSLGAEPDRLWVTGSLKFDMQHPASLREQAEVLRRFWGPDRSVLIAASTHDGEESQILAAFAAIKKHIPSCLLVLVPRHPERFGLTTALCQKRGLSIALRSEAPRELAGVDVFIGNSMGELPQFYAASDVAFVGGSLVPVGGHNMLEPAALGLPVLFGPHVFNFTHIAHLLLESGAARQIHSQEQLVHVAQELLTDANLRHHMGNMGRQLVEKNRGSLDRVMNIIATYMDARSGVKI